MGDSKDNASSTDASVDYGQKSLDVQKQMYDQTRADYTPYREAGTAGLGALTQKLGIGGDKTATDYGSLLKSFTPGDLTQDPGYQFRLQQGQQGIDRSNAAAGKYFTPEAAKALSDYNQNSASQEYGDAYNRYNADNDNIYNRLAGITGTGQSATGAVAQAGQNYATGASDIYTGIGNSINAANQSKANNSNSIFNSLIGAGGAVGASYFAPSLKFSDATLKENITFVGTENGHNLYSFTYRNDPNHKYVGVLAQEVLSKNPEAVVQMANGYLAVNYDAIGVSFREVH